MSWYLRFAVGTLCSIIQIINDGTEQYWSQY